MRKRLPVICVALGTFLLFVLPALRFLLQKGINAPFYFLAEDSFYYLSIALHSAHLPFFSNDAAHATNGFHPMWEWIEYSLSKISYFDLRSPHIVVRMFAFDIVLVGAAVSLFAAYIYKQTRRPWLSVLAVCPGLFWLVLGMGAPGYFSNWSFINGMETGIELLCLSLAVLLLGRDFRPGWRFYAGSFCLGLMVLSRLDDIFFLVVIVVFTVYKAPANERLRRLLAFVLPVLMLAGYLLYNHHTVGIFMPISAKAKAGTSLWLNFRFMFQALTGSTQRETATHTFLIDYTSAYLACVQMIATLAIGSAFLLRGYRRGGMSTVAACLAAGTICKSLYNLTMVAAGYQGAWYYGAPIASCNLILAIWIAELLDRASAQKVEEQPQRLNVLRLCRIGGSALALTVLAFVSFNVIAARRSAILSRVENTNLFKQGPAIAEQIRATGHPLFLEFSDGEISFATGLPSVSGFGLAGDVEAAEARKQGHYFDLLAKRGVTIAAAAGVYPQIMERSSASKVVPTAWGFNPEEIKHYRFEPFWSDPASGLVLYHIVQQPGQ